MVEAYAARQVSGESADTARRRGVPATWPMAWTAICLAAFVTGWWLLVPGDPVGSLEPGPVDPTAGLVDYDLDRISLFNGWAAPFQIATTVVPIVALLVLGLTPVGARLTARIGSTMYLQSLRALCIAIAVVGIAWLVTLPFEASLEAVNQAAGRLSGGWGPWVGRQFSQLFEWWAIAGLAVLAIRVSSKLFRRSWWCVLTLGAFVLVLAGTVLSGRLAASDTSYPALPDGPLRSDIVAIADDIGVGISDVQLVPQTPTSTTYNAYVTGVGDHHVVVLYETLLLRSTRSEVGVVAAHELGHVAEHDSDRRALLASLGAALVTAFVGAAATSHLVRRRARTEMVRISDAPAVPMLIALAMAGGVLVVPALNAASQAFELRADLTALEATGDPDGLATVVRRAAALDLRDPHPAWISRVMAAHPTPAERIAVSDAWAAAHD